jgi:NTE family protein
MIAFVLSGGGNRGALQAGALQALFAHGIQPDLIVGTSAGALNGAYIALYPSLEGVNRLADIWRGVRKQDIFPGNILTMAWRFITGQDSLFDDQALRRFVEKHFPPDRPTFGDVTTPVYITGANINTHTLYLFGEDPTAKLVDAVMVSSVAPPELPPIEFNGYQYLDGGLVTVVPIEIAMDKGATEIYAINVTYAGGPQPEVHGVWNITQRSITTLIYQQLVDDLEKAAEAGDALNLHHISIQAFAGLPLTNFDHMAEMVTEGRRATEAYLTRQQPTTLETVRAQALGVTEAPPPPGARIYVPRKRRSR